MEIGGGIITRKLIFAVLLVASLSLVGIAGASAADVGTAQKQYGNNYIVQKDINKNVKNYKLVKKSNKTQKKFFKKLKRVKKADSSKKITTQKVNNSAAKQVTTKKYKYKKLYKYQGKWRYKTVYKYKKSNTKYQKVKAASIYNSEKVVKVRSASANTSSINSLARSLTSGTSSQHHKGEKVFNWVRNNVKYKFYYNTKYGAAGVLKSRKANCTDASHLVVALSRAAGLEAKYGHGNVRFPSGKTYGHVWALVKVDGKWYKADATSKKNTFGSMRGTVVRFKGIHDKISF